MIVRGNRHILNRPLKPKITLRLRFTRDGEVTASEKVARVYRDWNTTVKLDMVFHADAGAGEWSRPVTINQDMSLDQGEWLVCAVDQAPPRRTRATYMTFSESADIRFDIAESVSNLPDFSGTGAFIGEPPDWITTVDDIPAGAVIRVLYRPEQGEAGDGAVVATTTAAADGTWSVTGLNTSFKYDIVARYAGCNDVIESNVSPV